MAEGEYRDKVNAEIASSILGYLEEHAKLLSTEVEDVIPFETSAESRKAVLLSLQKQGLIRLVGDRRTAYYQRIFRRKSVIKIDTRFVELCTRLYGFEMTRVILHAVEPAVFPKEEGSTGQPALRF